MNVPGPPPWTTLSDDRRTIFFDVIPRQKDTEGNDQRRKLDKNSLIVSTTNSPSNDIELFRSVLLESISDDEITCSATLTEASVRGDFHKFIMQYAFVHRHQEYLSILFGATRADDPAYVRECASRAIGDESRELKIKLTRTAEAPVIATCDPVFSLAISER
jgi:hypothetical protein